MKSKRNKRIPVDADQAIYDQNASQSLPERESFLNQIESIKKGLDYAPETPMSHVRESIRERKLLAALLPRRTKIWSTRSGRP